ncbi:Nucleoside hydrolase [Glarea lozoyensis ATCC 20868]|uniref:Nucleoside hydrolase n=1 Tax=Glarea lozoyensis (strain ATCC 20868 / MF5171) TaxID=1116229 RepID=S3D3M9_GLAL2|nr:Nucleoside hydrolase [Glarea lozoyensis ATCC 20868]EPE31739.1 Nucleoside hydrolase [Glarea lozoyensis ATCC 20868]
MASEISGSPDSSWTIPNEKNGVHLTEAERRVYEILLGVVKGRRQTNIEKPRVLVITDLAKDYDDLAAMVVLKELHRLGVIELLGFIANLEPAKDRARFGRGALDLLGLPDMRIVQGTRGFDDTKPEKERHRVEDYEFDCAFMSSDTDPRFFSEENPKERLCGQSLLRTLLQNAKTAGQKLTLLLLSSLADIHIFSKDHEDLMQASVSNIVLQGGYYISPDGALLSLDTANNNRYDPTAAREFHALIQRLKIPSTVYTKFAAIAARLDLDVFIELAKTKNEVGMHLLKVQKLQDISFYRNASQKDPSKRFRPDLDQHHFSRTRTNWLDAHPDGEQYPEGEEVTKFTKVVVYDALAALGVSGNDVLEALNVLDLPPSARGITEPTLATEVKKRHLIVGIEGESSGIHVANMVTALTALLKGSLITSPSN